MSHQSAQLSGLSIVCVFNDVDVRRECLDRSISAYSGDVAVEYIPVDNTAHAFTSAGAALNHGARRARHDVVVFVHQDVYLHSIRRLAEAARDLADGSWGVLGASGITNDGRLYGRMRDRVQLTGLHAVSAAEVDSVDEVLFMVRRDLVLERPLSEHPELAWHAYAVEYGARMRRHGLRVGALDCAITHNSLTTNLAKLDTAHRRVAEMHRELLPLRTTCGVIGARASRWRDAPVIRDHRWRLRWLQNSVRTMGIGRPLRAPVVFSDLRHDVDLVRFSAATGLHLVNLDAAGGFAEHSEGTIDLTRYARPVHMSAVSTVPEALTALDRLHSGESVVVADLTSEQLRDVVQCHAGPWVVGLQPGSWWLLGGPAALSLPEEWSRRQAVPAGSRRRVEPVPGARATHA